MTQPTPDRPGDGHGHAAAAGLEIVAGDPTPADLAVITVVVQALCAPGTAAASARPAWLTAARAEAVGGPPVADPAQLHAGGDGPPVGG